ISRRSAGRGKLPTWVVRILVVLRFTIHFSFFWLVDDLYSSHLHLLAPIENSINWDGASNREQEAPANSQHYNAASLLHVCRTRCFLSSEMDLQSNPSWL